jgi:hypothetical protein
MQQKSNTNLRRRGKGKPSRRGAERAPRYLSGIHDNLVKRMTVGSQVLTTSAFGIIPVTTNLQSDQCSQFPSTEWASYAARFQQYRVRRMRLHFDPCLNVNSVAGVASLNLLSVLYFSDFDSTSIPTSAAQIIADANFRKYSTAKSFTYTTTWEKNPNAKLWSPTNAAIPALSRFGVAFCSHTNVNLLPINTIIYTYLMDFEVELQHPM